MKWLKSVLNHNKTAITAAAGTAVIAAVDAVQHGQTNPKLVGAAALTAVAALAKSAASNWLAQNAGKLLGDDKQGG